MKPLILPFLGITLLAGATVQAATSLTTEQDKLSYSMGVVTGKAFQKHEIKINPQIFSLGVSDGYSGKKTQMTDEEMHTTLEQFQQQAIQKLQTQMKKRA
nr:FKBP-type peptidyl-prolyl cis-trans isomerase N-terminal domain-containing protein [Coxiella-like endosymbiont]